MTKLDSSTNTSPNRLAWFIFVAVTVFVYLFGLNIPLLGPDEPRYAQVAREMWQSGDWITPTLGGFNWFEKPALLYWLQIASYHLFGVNEFAARFGSALFGLGTIASLWLLGKQAEKGATNNEQRTTSHFANWLAVIAASTIGIIVFSRGASFDIILTFPMTAAMVSFYIYDRRVQRPATAGGSDIYAPLVGFYFFVGLALLAKGLIGIIFPFAIVAFYYVLSWRFPSKTFLISLLWGTLISLAVAATWYLPMYLTHGWPFIDEFFIQHHFQRYTSNKYLHPQPFYFFLWVLPLMTFPWLPFFLAAIWSSLRSLFDRRDAEKNPVATTPGSDKSLLLFSFAWIAVPLVFFSFAGSKLPGYILPAVPPAVVITALHVSKFVKKGGRRGNLILAIAYTMFALVVGLLIFVVPKFAEEDSVKVLIQTANQNGYSEAKVFSFQTLSQNAEFYAAGRLLRSDDGKQKRLLRPEEVLQEIRNGGDKPVLVLIPKRRLSQLTEDVMATEVLGDNGDLAIVSVKEK